MECLKRGLEDLSHPTIFSMGRETTEFHNVGTDTVELKAGETIVFDFFPRDLESRYFWDITRTFTIGKASPEIKRIYEDVLLTQQEVIDFLRPGIPLTEIEKKALESIEQKGYKTHRSPENKPVFKEGYGHAIGHGIGLAIHEYPHIYHEDIEGELKQGVVMTVEPSLRFPNKGIGVQIEDVIYVAQNSAINLTTYPKDWDSVLIKI